jgi:hypothetical protein
MTTSTWRPVPAARVGRDLATRTYAPPGRDWPRVQLALRDGPHGPEVRAYEKLFDRDDAGWDRVPLPAGLDAEVAAILRDADGRRAGRGRRRAPA